MIGPANGTSTGATSAALVLAGLALLGAGATLGDAGGGTAGGDAGSDAPVPQATQANRATARGVPRKPGRGGFRARKLGGRFSQPVYVTGPRGAKGLLFVVEQPGRIVVLRRGKRAGTFLDIRSKVQSGGERGLLSVAFSPRYRRDRAFYVYFTDKRGDIVVQRYRRSPRSRRRALPGSGRTVIKIEHRDYANHNGGQLQFGPDGMLYLGTGDGGAGGDPPENAQNPRRLLGKLLRIDPRPRGKGYRVPRDNPFVGRPGRDEIYSLGLRNPYRFSFDRRTGKLLIGDVGQSAWEEVDFVSLREARGANFGWDAFEGTEPFDSSDASPPPAQHTPPIFQYSHANGNCSITGGYVSRDRRIPALWGRYLYADFCRSQVRSLIPRRDGARGDRPTGLPGGGGISSFGEDTKGHLYYTTLSGDVYAIRPRR